MNIGSTRMIVLYPPSNEQPYGDRSWDQTTIVIPVCKTLRMRAFFPSVQVGMGRDMAAIISVQHLDRGEQYMDLKDAGEDKGRSDIAATRP